MIAREAIDGYIDAALAALGSDDSDFIAHGVKVTCRIDGCEWGFTCGEMEVWEIVTDCRRHWEQTHAGSAP